MTLEQPRPQNPKPSASPTPHTALFLFLLAVYMLTYTPHINSSDGLAMFSTAESLVRRGAMDIEQIRWMDLQQGTYGLDGLLYSRKGIGVPFGLLPLTWLGLIVPWFGTVGVSLLFNAIVTALTAVVLSAYLKQLGFNQQTGLIVALIFGLTTLAWPYAKSLFSDPLAGLLLLTAAYLLHKISSTIKEQENKSPLPFALLAGLLLGWNVATRYAEAIFLPLFGLLLLYYLWQNASRITHPCPEQSQRNASRINPLPTIIAFIAPILLIGLGLISFNISRYGDPINTGYLPVETFSGVLWEGIMGQLISPGRGLLIYCPVLIFSLGGMVSFFRRFRAEALVALSIIIIHLLLYGKWFMWHGGYAWGPRFMIPTLPFWAIFLAPIVEILDFRFWILDFQSFKRGVTLRPLLLRGAFLGLVILSFIFQLLMVAINFAPFQNSLLETDLPLFARQTFFDPQFSALGGAWAFINLDTLDLAWAWQGQFNWGLLALLSANIAITGFYLGKRLRRPPPCKSSHSLISNLLPYFSTLLALVFLLRHTHTLPAKSLQDMVATLNKTIQPTDAVIINNPTITTNFAELYKGQASVLGLNHGGFPLPDDVTIRLNETKSNHVQIWWIPNWLPIEDSAIEQTLLAQGFRAKHNTFDEQRLVLFAYPAHALVQTNLPTANFDHLINLVEITYPVNTQAGVAFPIELKWQAMAPLPHNYHVFIHLLTKEGQLIAQTDGQPVYWSRPTSTWRTGETVVDRHGLWIPVETTPGEYNLLIGLYDAKNGQRLPLPNGEDSINFGVRVD